eukprot:CAMPEP_0203970282 /NCGR_PEP_ID=MMETSP0359-20131031/97889_1 /ASSEMBLY_ACC=CAM_ASM_000338 /TAXON_ID=268821 /ORGANISM="Scrippsiella Hangoei, Strain SHTV-5" /LENGTH=72 /DNA_ID=CAMNT_0050908237 /DNA_START=134 /DNA_END=349 /DNA_ORIENTATION=+
MTMPPTLKRRRCHGLVGLPRHQRASSAHDWGPASTTSAVHSDMRFCSSVAAPIFIIHSADTAAAANTATDTA